MNFFDRVTEAQDRGGDAADSRPSGVDSLIEQNERLGYGNGQPLGNVDSYNQYPDSREIFFWPSTGPLLASIVDSEVVRDVSDLSEELDFSENVLVDICEFHNIDIPEESDYTPSPYINVPCYDGEERRINVVEYDSDYMTGYVLYVGAGLSVKEISQLTEDTERDVRRNLSRHGLI